ncbi:hypothetical protein PR202_ga30885 [Eleusine coracana subsp. coracana]|uniref:NAC domain-containing protein n=1 Tax=Eleusine coracana subsp. coracana TaxID=191504 RepID=A0AAV5DQS6_ELECO|nr:hypothetical protein PR202_ga30885 [Eleusine coracana subsp. coracana]
MSISVNGQSCVPPGFRFHPTEEELLNYYLPKKVASQEIDLDVIRDVDLNKLEPWDIQERLVLLQPQGQEVPDGDSDDRATAAGFWKATGRDKAIYNSVKRIGMRKTLVFYKGRAPHGQKSDWIMHEYRLDDPASSGDAAAATVTAASSDAGQEDGWVVCRVFKKKHHHKESSSASGKHHHGDHGSSKAAAAAAHGGLQYSSSDDALDQILQYMGRSCKQEHELLSPQGRPGSRYLRPIDTVLAGGHGFMKLPPLKSPSSAATSLTPPPPPPASDEELHHRGGGNGLVTDWAMMDRLVASHLNGQPDTPPAADQLCSFDGGDGDGLAFYSAAAATRLLGGGSTAGGEDDDLWSFARSAATSTTTTEQQRLINHVAL